MALPWKSWRLAVFVASLWRITFITADSRQLLGLRGISINASDVLVLSNEDPNESATVLATNFSFPLHAHSGSHHVHVYIGSPPQRQTLIVDTGSRVMAFPCKSCKNCGNHASPYYDPAKSTTQRASKCGNCLLEGIATCSLYGDQCEISQKYTEGSSWSAAEVEDMVWLGSSNVVESIEDHMQLAIPYAFGCQTSIKGLFQKQYGDGILGLARHESSLVTAYHKAASIPRNAYSLCLTLDAGYLSLGGSLPTRHHIEPMKFSPITREHGWYSVGVVGLFVGDLEVTSVEKNPKLLQRMNAGKGCILDSGTTDTYLPQELAKAFGKAVLDFSDGLTDFSEHARVKTYTSTEFQRLPNVTFVMANNVSLSMEPRNYMEGLSFDLEGRVQSWKGAKILTNRIYLEEQEGSVLGANAMFGYDILFDVQGHQVGIAKADCTAGEANTA